MDHSNAVRLKATERYLLNELDPDQLDQFEEHLFDCPDCAVDVRAAAMFLEQSKTVLSEVRGPELVKLPAPARKGWLDWLRPAFAAPVMAVLLAVVGYQNLVTYPRLHQALDTPHVLQWGAVNVGTWGANGPVIPVSPGKGFLLFVRIPPTAASPTTRQTCTTFGKARMVAHDSGDVNRRPMAGTSAGSESGLGNLYFGGAWNQRRRGNQGCRSYVI